MHLIKNKHEFQTFAAKKFEESNFQTITRHEWSIFIIRAKKFIQVGEVFDNLKDKNDLRIICLDQVTDPQNAAATLFELLLSMVSII